MVVSANRNATHRTCRCLAAQGNRIALGKFWAKFSLFPFPHHDGLFGGGSRIPISVGKSLTVRGYLFDALRGDFVLNRFSVIERAGVGHFPRSCGAGGQEWPR